MYTKQVDELIMAIMIRKQFVPLTKQSNSTRLLIW